MPRTLILAALLAALALAAPAGARNDRLRFPIADALGTASAKEKLDPAIRLYFGSQKHAKPIHAYGKDATNKKANAFGRDDKTACEAVFLSAVLQLQKRARQLGANAVVNITSVYRNEELASETEFECSAGNVVAGAVLRAEFVTLP